MGSLPVKPKSSAPFNWIMAEIFMMFLLKGATLPFKVLAAGAASRGREWPNSGWCQLRFDGADDSENSVLPPVIKFKLHKKEHTHTNTESPGQHTAARIPSRLPFKGFALLWITWIIQRGIRTHIPVVSHLPVTETLVWRIKKRGIQTLWRSLPTWGLQVLLDALTSTSCDSYWDPYKTAWPQLQLSFKVCLDYNKSRMLPDALTFFLYFWRDFMSLLGNLTMTGNEGKQEGMTSNRPKAGVMQYALCILIPKPHGDAPHSAVSTSDSYPIRPGGMMWLCKWDLWFPSLSLALKSHLHHIIHTRKKLLGEFS